MWSVKPMSLLQTTAFLMGPMAAGNAVFLVSIDGYGWSHFLLTLIDLYWRLLQRRPSSSLIHISFLPTPSGLANVKPTSVQAPGSSIGYRSVLSTPDHADARLSLSATLPRPGELPSPSRNHLLLPNKRKGHQFVAPPHPQSARKSSPYLYT